MWIKASRGVYVYGREGEGKGGGGKSKKDGMDCSELNSESISWIRQNDLALV